MGDSSQSSEKQKTDRNPVSKDKVWKVSVEKKDCIGFWTAGDVCYGLTKSLSNFAHVQGFCLCLEILPETNIKGDRHGYCWGFLARFLLQIKNKEPSKMT